MSLFAPDLYRNFALGFAAGALIVGAATIEEWGPHMESPANAAAPLAAADQPAAEFLIEPFEVDE